MTDSSTRRRMRRRGRGNGLTESSHVEGDADLQAVSDAPPMREPLSDADSALMHRQDAEEQFTPGSRIAEVEAVDKEYAMEHRLGLLHRMLMRRVPLDQIAQQLNVSIATVKRDRKKLADALKKQAQRLDINEIIGDTLGFYREVGGMTMRVASNSKMPMNMRLAAMRTSLSSRNDMHKFLNTAGVYDVLRYKVADDQSGSDIEKLMSLTETLLEEDDIDLDNDQLFGGVDDEDDLEINLI